MDEQFPSAVEPSVSTRAFAEHGVFVALAGELDLAFVPALRAAVAHEIAVGHRHLVVDLSSASLIDCSCIGAILGELGPLRTHPDATVLFAGATGTVARLLHLLDFGRVCELVDDADAAAALALDPDRVRAEGWRQTGGAA